MFDIFSGILQGLTEFLPISSSGHLVIFNNIFRNTSINIEDITLLHLGTLFSIIIFYRVEIINIIKNFREGEKILQKVLMATLPAALIGFFSDGLSFIYSSPQIVLYTGVAYLIMSLILFRQKTFTKDGEKRIVDISYYDSFIIGIAQALALFPGISRAGVTLVAGLILGVNKKDALLFSFLLGIPTIFGAGIYTIMQNGLEINLTSTVATILAFLSGLLAINILVRFTLDSNLYKFGFYTLILSLISFITI